MKLTKKQPEWEKEFDKKFVDIDEETKFFYGEKLYGNIKVKDIKQFISQVRQEAIRETLDKVEKAIKDLYEMRKVKRIVTKEAYGGFPPIFYEELTFTDLWWDRFIKKIDKMKKQAVDDLTNLKNKLKEK